MIYAQEKPGELNLLQTVDSNIVVKQINTYTFEFRDTKTDLVLKKMSYPEIEMENPFIQYFNARLEERVKPENSLNKISSIQRQDLSDFLYSAQSNAISPTLSNKLNFVHIRDAKIVPYSTGVILEYVAVFYENNSDYDDPVLCQTRFLRIDKSGEERVVWTDNYLYAVYDELLSRDGNYILSRLFLGSGEGSYPKQVGLYLINLKDGTKDIIPIFPRFNSSYDQARASSINGPYFLELYENSECSIIRLVVDPYTKTYYTRTFICPNIREYKIWEDKLYKSDFDKERYYIDFSKYEKHSF
ncbi:MAG: hypothetical protein R2792_18150 [Saprospiraceae bacterium]